MQRQANLSPVTSRFPNSAFCILPSAFPHTPFNFRTHTSLRLSRDQIAAGIRGVIGDLKSRIVQQIQR